MKPETEWKRTPVPHLAIIDADTWAAVRDRLAAGKGRHPVTFVKRRNGVFSGLLKCGECGRTYTAYGSAGRLICAGHREGGDAACGNRRTLSRAAIEARILDGLETRLLAPEAVAAYVRAYHRHWADQAAAEARQLAPLERRVAELDRAIGRIVDAIASGAAGKHIAAKLTALEAEHDEAAARLAEARANTAPAPAVTLHPGAAGRYADQVRQLQQRLGAINKDSPAADRDLVEAVRAMVSRIVITPESEARGAAVSVVIEGDLARFLTPAPDPSGDQCLPMLVAGGGIEPPTCGL
ncbi:MAG: recombinase zinc beta ribbon domain-containing protein [Caulobacter sp.]|nr:recombinase zinc beta ribbon domain-containing protein [Caulobacter sp.]